MGWIHNPEYWVLIAFLIFCGIMVYYGVPGSIARALDKRADTIKTELDEARRLREEAQALLDEYKKKQRDAESEAQAIIDNAKREAETLASETRRSLAEMVERRTKSAEEKIARAEAQAVSDVKAAAVDRALAAAEIIMAGRTASTAAGSIDASIRDLKGKLN
ncbi:MAG: F0F1 ATP synthase subunit B [Hyphomicrobiaceae bacterium]|nr:F0F1 ATP synthase subunit B [Hyphomicrobiaceae bacterium]